MTGTGYRCMECDTVSDDGANHAPDCGQPARDGEASKRRWYEQLAELIPPTGSRAAYAYRHTIRYEPPPFKYGALPLPAEDRDRIDRLADGPYRTASPPVPPRTSFVNPVVFYRIVLRHSSPPIVSFQHVTSEWKPTPHMRVATSAGPWSILADPDCPRDYTWPESAPPEVAEVIREAMAAAKERP